MTSNHLLPLVISALGIKGSFQVHSEETFLIPDLRAYQIFLNAGKRRHQIQKHLEGWTNTHPEIQIFFLRDEQADSLNPNKNTSEFISITCALSEVDLKDIPEHSIFVLPPASQESPGGFYGLVHLVDRLLGPGGCPWDQAQTHESLKKHLIEEAYEVCEAIDSGLEVLLQEELGDLLLQPVLHAQIEKKEEQWDIHKPIQAICDKLIRRHPHVFGNLKLNDAEEVLKNWDKIKKDEKKLSQISNQSIDLPENSILGNLPKSMPSLSQALRVSQRAARVGFDWPNITGVLEKVKEELEELTAALKHDRLDQIEFELGDLLFSLVNIARSKNIDPEEALKKMLDRFKARFAAMEQTTSKELDQLSPSEWSELWNQAKANSSLK